MVTTINSYPTPQHNESYEEFVVRAHHELINQVPEPMERNRLVWNTWESLNGDKERYRARQFFPDDRYRRVDDVCYWHEHEAVSYDTSGNPVAKSNDVNRLIEIARENNSRIADTDSFSSIVDKHTQPPVVNKETGTVERPGDLNPPRTLGHPGPFRLGMIGRLQPRFALFADEFQRVDRQDVLADRPRRSVEVLTLKANNRPYIDPIAALSESPRLPLPLTAHYSHREDEIDRYEGAPVAAYPGGNTFIPGGESRKKQDQYCSGDSSNPNQLDDKMYGTQQPNNGPAGDQSNEQARGIIDALMSTPLMQWMLQFAQSQGFNSGGGAAPGGANQPAQQENFMGGMGNNLNPAMRYGADQTQVERETPADPKPTQNPDPEPEYELVPDTPEVSLEQFSALQANVRDLVAENAKLRSNQAQLAAESADAKRDARLSQIHGRFPHFVDLEKEQARCLYSAGATMTDQDFNQHIEMLEQYAAKAPPITGQMVPSGEVEVERDQVEVTRYEAEVSQRATEIFTTEQEANRFITADEAYQRAKQEIDTKATA